MSAPPVSPPSHLHLTSIVCFPFVFQAAPVPLERVQRILDPDLVYVSERQMGGGMGMGNPHGEHGEDCYDVTQCEMSDRVQIVVRTEREVLW